MKIRKSLARLTAVLLVGMGTLVATQTPALAVAVALPSGARGSASYTFDAAANTLSLTVSAGTLPSNYCLTLFLDPSRVGGVGEEGSHYDIRAVRTCRSNTSRASGLQREGSTYGVDLTGINKLSTCYGPLNTAGTCRHTTGSLTGVNHNFNSHMECTRAWTRAANGSEFYFSGGSPTDCNG